MKNIAFLIISLLVSGQSYSKDELGFPFQKKYEIYKVEGNSQSEINASFDANKPNALKQKGYDGYTSWTYSYNADYQTCKIYDFNLQVNYTLPQIKMSAVSPQSTEYFRSYIEKLYRHERVHCAITLKSIHDIYLAFKAGQHGNCGQAHQKARELENAIQQNNELFDAYTSHGDIELPDHPFGEGSYLTFCDIPYEPIFSRQ